MVKERTEELRNCNELIDVEIRSEEEECSLVKRKLQESNDKFEKLTSKYMFNMLLLNLMKTCLLICIMKIFYFKHKPSIHILHF